MGIEDPLVINKILQHLALQASHRIMLPFNRGPPVGLVV